MHFILQKKISPNNGTLLNGVFKPKLVNNPFASYFFTNADFLIPHTPHFDDKVVLPILVFETFESTRSVLHFKQ